MLVADWLNNNNKDRDWRKQAVQVAALALLLCLSHNSFAQPHSGSQPRPIQASSPAVKPLYQRSDTWYEFLLKQFNPDDLDYGKWMEQHRRVFLSMAVEKSPVLGV
jgi:hypothetical protein